MNETDKPKPGKSSSRISSIKFAFEGLKTLFRDEPNARFHLVATIAAIFLSVWFDISNTEWIAVIGCIVSVFTLEIINTAIEHICNLISIEYHPAIKKIKDLSAAAVLLVSIFSLITGILIFLPKLINL